MARLTEEMVIARSKQSDLAAIKKLNCWGAELGDVSLLRRMPNVEVLALSINKIRTLGDFAWCRRLRELYVRKNEVRDLREIRHLRHLPHLAALWLDENPCTMHPEYRMTVLRNLPNLEKLDNVAVHPDEVSEAMCRGVLIPDSDDEGSDARQESCGSVYRERSSESSPERETEVSRPPPPPHARQTAQPSESGELAAREPPSPSSDGQTQQCPLSPSRRARAVSPERERDDRYDHPAALHNMTRSHYDPRTPRETEDSSLRHSQSAQSVKEYTYGDNGEWHGALTTAPHHYCDRSEACQQVPQRGGGECEREGARGEGAVREREREYPSAVMAEHRGFTRRPVTRNSNLLSAVLCLVKELDYNSLEVAEMAVRCRMDELASQR